MDAEQREQRRAVRVAAAIARQESELSVFHVPSNGFEVVCRPHDEYHACATCIPSTRLNTAGSNPGP